MDNQKSNKYFYCYSKRMYFFIRSFNISYKSKALNKNSNTYFYLFEKSEKLDKIIALYNQVKYSI